MKMKNMDQLVKVLAYPVLAEQSSIPLTLPNRNGKIEITYRLQEQNIARLERSLLQIPKLTPPSGITAESKVRISFLLAGYLDVLAVKARVLAPRLDAVEVL